MTRDKREQLKAAISKRRLELIADDPYEQEQAKIRKEFPAPSIRKGRKGYIANPDHGTEGGYAEGCRCDECRAVATKMRRSRMGPERVKTHGTGAGYRNGCRCRPCKDAYNAYKRERRRIRREQGIKSVPLGHGRSAYNGGCRCDICREAQRAYKTAWRARKRLELAG